MVGGRQVRARRGVLQGQQHDALAGLRLRDKVHVGVDALLPKILLVHEIVNEKLMHYGELLNTHSKMLMQLHKHSVMRMCRDSKVTEPMLKISRCYDGI